MKSFIFLLFFISFLALANTVFAQYDEVKCSFDNTIITADCFSQSNCTQCIECDSKPSCNVLIENGVGGECCSDESFCCAQQCKTCTRKKRLDECGHCPDCSSGNRYLWRNERWCIAIQAKCFTDCHDTIVEYDCDCECANITENFQCKVVQQECQKIDTMISVELDQPENSTTIHTSQTCKPDDQECVDSWLSNHPENDQVTCYYDTKTGDLKFHVDASQINSGSLITPNFWFVIAVFILFIALSFESK